jgi:hypothetical protein
MLPGSSAPVIRCYRRLFCREPSPAAVEDLLQAKTGDVFMLPITGSAHPAGQPVRLGKATLDFGGPRGATRSAESQGKG